MVEEGGCNWIKNDDLAIEVKDGVCFESFKDKSHDDCVSECGAMEKCLALEWNMDTQECFWFNEISNNMIYITVGYAYTMDKTWCN